MKTSRFFILAMTFIFMFAWPGSIFAQTADPPSGTGTSEAPYLIATLNNLYWVTQNSSSWDKHFKQTAEIDATTTSGWDGGAGFLPIGNLDNPFTGTFNGQGGAIGMMSINRPGSSYVGMFGVVSGGIVENVFVITNVFNGNRYVGAIAGLATDSALIRRCFVASQTGLPVSGNKYVGGIAGSLDEGTLLDESCSTVGVTGNSCVGGLTGRNLADISNCYAAGTVNGLEQEGGIAGAVVMPTVTNSFWDTDVSGLATSSGGTGKTTTEMLNLATYTDVATTGLDTPWDLVGIPYSDTGIADLWNMDTTGSLSFTYPFPSYLVLPMQPAGSGTLTEPYLIETLYNLYWLTSTPSAWGAGVYIEQTADIYAYSTAYINFGTGWKNMGDIFTNFEAVYSGNGHEIKGLTINGLSRGFIDYLDNPGSITDLHLTDLDYNHTQSGGIVGGIVGQMGYNADPTLSKCSASGIIYSTNNAGLLVGVLKNGTIEQCWTSGSVSGGYGVGGLIGRKNIHQTYDIIISDCYSTVNVTCTGTSAGGLIGDINSNINSTTIENCYSTGQVSVPADIGGFIGYINPDYTNYTISACFWDTETSGTTDGVGNLDPDPAGLTGKTTVEMKTESTFTDAGWDFVGESTNGTEDIWDIDPTQTINTGYPFFSWQDTYAVWNGSQNNDWNNPANWSGGPGVPTSVKNVIIPDVANDPVISTAAEVANLIIQSGATLTIDTDGSLTVNGAPITDAGGNGGLIMLTK